MDAKYYRESGGRLQCLLCPQFCVIDDGRTGFCRTRRRSGGRLLLENYGRYTSLALDPVEKKPLYHFHPGAPILSIGGFGCNLGCVFCQNCEISHGTPPTRNISPQELAVEAEKIPGNVGVAFTYNEPLVWFEFILDCAPFLRRKRKKVVLVTNGSINPKSLEEILPHIDAMNIDLKSFTEEFYEKYCSGRLKPVKETIRRAARAGTLVEVTLLMIPGLNDSAGEIAAMTEWLAGVDPRLPFHISRFFPHHDMADRPPTPMKSLERAYDIARRSLNYVYLGNQPEQRYNNTYCPHCGAMVIERRGYSTSVVGLKDDDTCATCGEAIWLVR